MTRGHLSPQRRRRLHTILLRLGWDMCSRSLPTNHLRPICRNQGLFRSLGLSSHRLPTRLLRSCIGRRMANWGPRLGRSRLMYLSSFRRRFQLRQRRRRQLRCRQSRVWSQYQKSRLFRRGLVPRRLASGRPRRCRQVRRLRLLRLEGPSRRRHRRDPVPRRRCLSRGHHLTGLARMWRRRRQHHPERQVRAPRSVRLLPGRCPRRRLPWGRQGALDQVLQTAFLCGMLPREGKDMVPGSL